MILIYGLSVLGSCGVCHPQMAIFIFCFISITFGLLRSSRKISADSGNGLALNRLQAITCTRRPLGMYTFTSACQEASIHYSDMTVIASQATKMLIQLLVVRTLFRLTTKKISKLCKYMREIHGHLQEESAGRIGIHYSPASMVEINNKENKQAPQYWYFVRVKLVTDGIHSQRASNAKSVIMSWRHQDGVGVIWSYIFRDHFVYAPSQWETTLQCNVASHWLGAYTEISLLIDGLQQRRQPNFRINRKKYTDWITWNLDFTRYKQDIKLTPMSTHYQNNEIRISNQMYI